MSVTDELLINAERYAQTFDKGDLPLPPGRGVAVVACMDARLNVYGLLGLTEGDAHVIRNAGGIVTQEAPIHVSNVQVVDADNKPTRVGKREDENGRRVRFSRRTGKDL